jgi:hypothetical protein
MPLEQLPSSKPEREKESDSQLSTPHVRRRYGDADELGKPMVAKVE